MSDGATPYVQFRNVEKTYDGNILVVKDLNLSVRKREFLTFLGPSGSGKTTTLMLLAGFERPNRGEILLDGEDLVQIPPHRRDFGFVFQDYALFPHMTVAQNIAYPLESRKTPREAVRSSVDGILNLIKLRELADRKPSQLSGGQQQRVALARALVFQPRILLMDEPLGALDKQLREHMQIEIKSIQKQLGITAIYVTHDQSEALTMSDRIAVFNDGRIHQVASPVEVYENPAEAFVAGFVGANNRLPGVVRSVDGPTVTLSTGAGERVSGTGAGLAVGERASVWIRPEQLRLSAGPAADRNCLAVSLVEVVYHGDRSQLMLRHGSSERIITVSVARGDLTEGLLTGQDLHVRWHEQDARVLR